MTGGFSLISHRWRSHSRDQHALLPCLKADDKKEGVSKTDPGVSLRELRFKDFASLSYKGELYMTATDFLDSTTRDQAKGKT